MTYRNYGCLSSNGTPAIFSSPEPDKRQRQFVDSSPGLCGDIFKRIVRGELTIDRRFGNPFIGLYPF